MNSPIPRLTLGSEGYYWGSQLNGRNFIRHFSKILSNVLFTSDRDLKPFSRRTMVFCPAGLTCLSIILYSIVRELELEHAGYDTNAA